MKLLSGSKNNKRYVIYSLLSFALITSSIPVIINIKKQEKTSAESNIKITKRGSINGGTKVIIEGNDLNPKQCENKIEQIHGENASVCAVKTSGETYCTGYNNYGQLGNGMNPEYNAQDKYIIGYNDENLVKKFVKVKTNIKMNSVVTGIGNHNCSISRDGQLYCWGLNSYGQLGLGTNVELEECDNDDNSSEEKRNRMTKLGYCVKNMSEYVKNTPQKVLNPIGITSWKTVDLGEGHTCAIAQNDELYC